MKLRDRRRWEQPELNIISLVDVVLMLLVFFMMTTHFIQNASLTVNLPSASVPAYTKPDGIEIAVDAEGRYYVNQRAVGGANGDSLRAALLTVAGDRRDLPIILRADARSTHQSVVTVMDVAGALGFSQLQILTEQGHSEASP